MNSFINKENQVPSFLMSNGNVEAPHVSPSIFLRKDAALQEAGARGPGFQCDLLSSLENKSAWVCTNLLVL